MAQAMFRVYTKANPLPLKTLPVIGSCKQRGNSRLRGDFGRVVRIRKLRGDVEPAAPGLPGLGA